MPVIRSLVFVLLTLVAVLTMHLLDHAIAHQPFAAPVVHEHHDSDSRGETDRNDRPAAAPAVIACAFLVLVPATRVLRSRAIVRHPVIVVDAAASQLFSGPEPPVPRFLLAAG